jgi:hypothetical protein
MVCRDEETMWFFAVLLHSEDCSLGVTVKSEIHFRELHGTLFLIVIVAGFKFELAISGPKGELKP